MGRGQCRLLPTALFLCTDWWLWVEPPLVRTTGWGGASACLKLAKRIGHLASMWAEPRDGHAPQSGWSQPSSHTPPIHNKLCDHRLRLMSSWWGGGGEAKKGGVVWRVGGVAWRAVGGVASPLAPLAPVLGGEMEALGVDAQHALQHGALVALHDVPGQRQDVLALQEGGGSLH